MDIDGKLWELIKIRGILTILRMVEKDYSHHTIDNIIQQIESREKFLEKNK